MSVKSTLFMLIALILFCALAAQTASDTLQSSYTAEYNKNYTGAIDAVKTLEKAEPNDAFYKLRLGWLYYLSGKYGDALSYYQKSNTLSASLDAQEGIVNCYLALGNWNDALATANTVLQNYPTYTTMLLKAGYAQYVKKDYSQAINYYQRVLDISPYNFEAQGYLVAANYYNNNLMEARKHYQFLKKYYPSSVFVTDFAKAFE